MSNPSPDCKKGLKIYECTAREEVTKRYRKFDPEASLPRDVWEEAKGKVAQKYPDFVDTLIFTGQTPRTGTKKLIGSSSSMEPSSDDCCGKDKGDNSYLVGREMVNNPYRRPLGDGPKEQMTYKFKYYRPDIQKLTSIYRSAKAYYGNLINPPPPDCCKYVGSPNSTVCTPSCAAALSQRVYATLRHLDNLYNSANWKALVQFCKVQMPVKPDTFSIDRSKPTYEFEEVTLYDLKFKSFWKCVEKDSRPCCCDCDTPCEESEDCPEGQTCKDGCCKDNSDCDCEKICEDLSDCADNEGCYGNPDCDYSPKGCCKDDCADKCPEQECPFGETCKDGCCWDGDCRYGPWEPPTDSRCEGEIFTQERLLLRGSLETCEPKYRQTVGTKQCPSTSSSIGISEVDSLIQSLKSQIIIR